MRRPVLRFGFACGLLVIATGCQRASVAVSPRDLPVVPVAQPVRREVTDYIDFTGRTDAIHSVEVRPRVTGYLVDMPFAEGSEVKKGDPLFVIDQRPYQAQLDQAQGQVDLYKASLRLARVTLARDRAINASSRGSISQQQFDQEQAVVEEAEARVRASEKTLELYRLNYDFTRVLSEIDGRVSRYYLTRGNLVNAYQTLLTTIVSVDPMYASFEMDTPTLLRIRQAVNEGKNQKPASKTTTPVFMGLPGEEGFTHKGTINFFDNKINFTTGTILVRGIFPNPLPPGGRRLLSPGMFVKIRQPIGQPHPAVLVYDKCVASDQGLKCVYVLDAENKVQYRRVTLGALQDDGLQVIEKGLHGDEWVVVGGLQQLRPKMEAKPERVPMPSLALNQTAVEKRQREPGKSASPRKLSGVPVSQPIRREVTDFVDFTGRTDAVHSVDIRPRVTGYLVDMPFEEGAEIKQGDLLFVVDPRPYQAQLEQAQGQVDLYKASLGLARTTLARDRAINALQPGAVSPQQFDQEQAAVDEADARVKAYEKAMEVYRLNYDFTRVLSPIDGQISRYYLTRGNLVNQDQTLLTTIVSVDPMYAYFEMDEPTLLRSRKAINEGKIKVAEDRSDRPVFMGLQGEEGFPHEGMINFIDNQVNATTGSIMVRGVFSNPLPSGGRRLLSPGMYVRIRLPVGLPRPAVLVIDRAVSSDQGMKYVFVLDAANTIQSRRITTGALQEDGLRVIEQGLNGDEWVVVGGLQQVREHDEVANPERISMPALAVQPTTAGPQPGETGKPANPSQPAKSAAFAGPGRAAPAEKRGSPAPESSKR
jgi:multidrug efflux system membrane fusion protein